MPRRLVCEVCEGFMLEDAATLLTLTLKFPNANGQSPPVIDTKVDLCSATCLETYMRSHAATQLKERMARWAPYLPGITGGSRRPPEEGRFAADYVESVPAPQLPAPHITGGFDPTRPETYGGGGGRRK